MTPVRHGHVNVRERLPRDMLLIVAWGIAGNELVATRMLWLAQGYLGADSHAYWDAFTRHLYSAGPMTLDAYLYSPVFAQVLWPLTRLPWPVFGILMSLADALTLLWLVRPLGWRWSLPLLLISLPEISQGNVFILMAAAVLGFRYPGTWALSALTKITTTVGIVWWIARREWRPLVVTLATILAVSLPSIVLAPELWRQWFSLLLDHSTASTRPLGDPWIPALAYRLPIALAITVWAGRRNHRWAIPIAMVLASPVVWFGTYTMLAAIPRLRHGHDDHVSRDAAPGCGVDKRSSAAGVPVRGPVRWLSPRWRSSGGTAAGSRAR